ncbi:uncharacterized protein LOC105220490 [Zeugodacus cucurbitae]|uniref:Axin-1 n=1 Tax=Zeugodacus cucurbitae TaxID=28588 RepID=A0A0A1X5L5_ZEUCU|nr:uncharacterized protein LOC105220490 [Zeugodacus cucurbitae]
MVKSKYLLINKHTSRRSHVKSIILKSMHIIAIALLILIIRVIYMLDAHHFYRTPNDISSTDYFVFTSECRIPYVDPFSSEALDRFEDFSHSDCGNDVALIQQFYDHETRQYKLHMNMSAIEEVTRANAMNINDMRCCYRRIKRAGENGFSLSPCHQFQQDFVVPRNIDYLLTECYSNKTKVVVEKNAFTFIQYRNLTGSYNATRISKSGIKRPSVLLLGIDSLSRINLRRVMPKTFMHLQRNHWFELQGFNKVGENTFPNLIALLTSYNATIGKEKCQFDTYGAFNQRICNIIWKNFRDYGYRTAYAEDKYRYSTFNYAAYGFVEQPTDYYLRPFTICIENNLHIKKIRDIVSCIGHKYYAEYILDYALQLSFTYSEEPIFGLFWVNTIGHDYFDTPSVFDLKMLEYLERMQAEKILERSIVFFLGDHGMRWGPLLRLKSGFLEERLPMMFISLPQWYRNEHPDFVKALQVNRNRLTSPFDIYATLKNILEVTNPQKEFHYLNDTTQGISVFREIPENRTCHQAGISDHWCACLSYKVVSINDTQVQKVAHLLIDEMNKYIVSKNIETKCAVLTLSAIQKAFRKTDVNGYKMNNVITYRLWYLVHPGLHSFEATVLFNTIANQIKINIEDINRLDSYKQTAYCVDEKQAKEYCICRE